MTTEQAVERVMRHVTRDQLADAVRGVVDIPSPTGSEGRLAAWIVDNLIVHGVGAHLQAFRLEAEQRGARRLRRGDDQPLVLDWHDPGG